jgi:hypothetical protein
MFRYAVSVSAASGYAAHLDTGYMLASDVADFLGMSATTVRRWHRRDPTHLGSKFTTRFGGHQIWLYDREAVRRLAVVAGNAADIPRRGRPRLWDPAERRERRRQLCAASYQRRRAAELAQRGDLADARAALARAEAISRALERQASERAGDAAARAAMLDRANHENWSPGFDLGYTHGVCRTRHRTAAAASRCRLARGGLGRRVNALWADAELAVPGGVGVARNEDDSRLRRFLGTTLPSVPDAHRPRV